MEVWIKLSVLSILQGVAEFLPISSSGHLVLFQSLLGIDAPGEDLEILLHAGTMLSIVVFYRKLLIELISGFFRGEKQALKTVLCICISAVPAIVFYLLLKDGITKTYESTAFVGAMLLVTGVLLLTMKFLPSRELEVTPKRSLIVGIAQAIAILPGISRSGSTISCARILGIKPEKAAAFSFIMSLPLIAGATLLMLFGHTGAEQAAQEVTVDFSCAMKLYAFALSAAVGYLSLKLLVKMLKKGIFWFFGVYCLIAGACAILFM